MKNLTQSFLILLSVSIAVVYSLAQDEHSTIDGQRAHSYVYVLAADSMEGRRSGLPGGEKAAAWVAAKFEEFGLKPGVGDSSYFNNFTLDAPYEEPPMILRRLPNEFCSDTMSFEYGDEFISFAYGGEGRVEGQLVFVSYGIQAPEKGRDDYGDLDLMGKIALVMRGAPSPGGHDYWQEEAWNGSKSSLAHEKGASAFLMFQGDRAVKGSLGQQNFRADLPAFWLSEETLNSILDGTGYTLDSLNARGRNQQEGYHLELPVRVMIEAHGKIVPDAPTRNVVAKISGTDPDLAHEIVLIGAHMDHLGIDAAGRVYNGAEDNASGTSLLLELARTAVERNLQPLRSIYFCAFAAEELGLDGAENFVDNPPVNLDSVVVMINMDMVGEGGEGASIGGGCNYPAIFEHWEKAWTEAQNERIYQFKPGYYSDHAPFEEAGVPAFVVFGRGDHQHYHHPDDDADLVQPEVLAEVGNMIYAGIQAFAHYSKPLSYANRYEDYLWESAEVEAFASAGDHMEVRLDTPDLILYSAGSSVHAKSRDKLGKLLVEMDRLESSATEQWSDDLRLIDTFNEIPQGQRYTTVVMGVDNPAVFGDDPGIWRMLQRLNVNFVRIDAETGKEYFGKSSLNKKGQRMLRILEGMPQLPIWEVSSIRDVEVLIGLTDKPMVIVLRGGDGFEDFNPNETSDDAHFLLLDCSEGRFLTAEEVRAVATSFGEQNVGVVGASKPAGIDMIEHWRDDGMDQQTIQGLLGNNLVRYFRASGRH